MSEGPPSLPPVESQIEKTSSEEKPPPLEEELNREMIQQLPAFKIRLHRERLKLARLQLDPQADPARIEELETDIEELELEIEGREAAFDAEEEERRSSIEKTPESIPSSEEMTGQFPALEEMLEERRAELAKLEVTIGADRERINALREEVASIERVTKVKWQLTNTRRIELNPEKTPAMDEVRERKEKMLSLAAELFESNEIFSFSGVDPESYLKMKASDEEYPGLTTPTDEIIERLKNEGMKVVLGKNPQSGNIYILPAGSNDIEMDSISPKQLQINEGMDEKLTQLIRLVRG